MIDVLVLDEADRMIADGHFKEMRDILAHIYTTRLRMKNALKNKQSEEEKAQQEELMELLKSKEEDEEVYEKDPNVDWSKVKDMFDEEELVKEIE